MSKKILKKKIAELTGFHFIYALLFFFSFLCKVNKKK